jgi:aspartate carbamoyltransferase catalytic subunit
MKPYAAILHPFPRDKEFGEIPPSIDDDERAFYFRQARNGMWARAALVAHIFDVDGEISDYYERYNSDRQIAPH